MIRDEQITTMREIKFRGRSVHTDDWCYGSFVNNPDEPTICGFDIWADGDSDWREEKVEPHTVGQYTGLCDQNGKEIYEGDVVRIDGSICIISWHDYLAQFYLALPEDRPPHYNDAKASVFEMMKHYDIEVIGNVHDNPELLKGGEK